MRRAMMLRYWAQAQPALLQLYASRAGIGTAVFEEAVVGGWATYASTIDNYPGFPKWILGSELTWEGLHQEEPSDLVAVGKGSTAGINASAFVKV